MLAWYGPSHEKTIGWIYFGRMRGGSLSLGIGKLTQGKYCWSARITSIMLLGNDAFLVFFKTQQRGLGPEREPIHGKTCCTSGKETTQVGSGGGVLSV